VGLKATNANYSSAFSYLKSEASSHDHQKRIDVIDVMVLFSGKETKSVPKPRSIHNKLFQSCDVQIKRSTENYFGVVALLLLDTSFTVILL
jgi:hypothetical protein